MNIIDSTIPTGPSPNSKQDAQQFETMYGPNLNRGLNLIKPKLGTIPRHFDVSDPKESLWPGQQTILIQGTLYLYRGQ